MPTVRLSLRIPLLLIGLGVLITRCGEDDAFEKHLTEGVIEYELSYPELDSNNLMLEMLPDEMVMHFKEDKFRSELKTGAGIVEMTLIANGADRQMHNMVKLFSDRYVLSLDQQGAREMVNVIPPFQIKNLDGIDTIADAACKRVLIDFGAAKNESYIFAFTDEVGMIEPNWCTPYHEIQGVLLDYHIENYGIVMHLRAKRIIAEEVEDELFVVDERYQELSKEEFDDLVIKNMKIFME